jgi:PTH1 family peptidyl-tRNA hydrolase
VADFVLHPPRRDDADAIDAALERGLSAIEPMIAGRSAEAMKSLHSAPPAPPASKGHA